MTSLREKLCSERGESLTEVLAAIAVSALAILLLTMAVSTASNMNARSRTALDTYYETSNELVSGPSTHVDGSVTLTEKGSNAAAPVWEDTIDVTYAISEREGDGAIASYEEKGGGA